MTIKEIFRQFSNVISQAAGKAYAFTIALSVVIIWAASGPYFNFSNTWQLFINTGTTIVTFLMVFLIQSTQNRDGKAMQLKLDELIRSSDPSSYNFLDIEDLSDDDLEELDEEFKRLHDSYQDNAPLSLHKLHSKIKVAHQKRRQFKSE